MNKLAFKNNKILILFKTALKITMQELALQVESSHLLLCLIDGCPFCYCFGFCLTTQVLQACSTQLHLPLIREDPNRITHKSSNYRKNTILWDLTQKHQQYLSKVWKCSWVFGSWHTQSSMIWKNFQCCFSQLQDPFLVSFLSLGISHFLCC